MSFGSRIIDPTEISSSIVADVKSDVDTGKTAVIQFLNPIYTDQLLRNVDGLAKKFGERLQVRFYGHYGKTFDASVLKHLPHVSNLAIDSLSHIANEETITQLDGLRRLSFGVFEHQDKNVLSKFPLEKLKELTVLENRKRSFDLHSLTRASALETLYLEGHTRNISSIAQLPGLRRLTLRSIASKQSLAFLNSASELRELKIILGGRTSVAELDISKLQVLQLVRIQGLVDLGPLSRFSHLKALCIDDQPRITDVTLDGLQLQRLTLSNCKLLEKISGLDRQSMLEELFVVRTKLPVEEYLNAPWAISLRSLGLLNSSSTWNRKTADIVKTRGQAVYGSGWF
jgi:hypothetical protein